jgi:hypothetical protein
LRVVQLAVTDGAWAVRVHAEVPIDRYSGFPAPGQLEYAARAYLVPDE